MRVRRSRRLGSSAVVTLTLYVIVTALRAITLCVEAPHSHGGVAAPDCSMHHQHDATQASAGHAHHGAGHEEVAPHLSCRCSSDPISAIVADAGVMTETTSLTVPFRVGAARSTRVPAPLDLRGAPTSPPPRLVLS